MWLDLYQRWVRIFSEAIPWSVSRGTWMDVVHAVGLAACSMGLVVGLLLLRGTLSAPAGRRTRLGRLSYPLAQFLISAGLVYWIFLGFGWEGIFRGYPTIFAGVMIGTGGMAVLYPRVHRLLVGERLLDEFALTAFYRFYLPTGGSVSTDPGVGVRVVSLAGLIRRSAGHVVKEIAADRRPDSGEGVFAFCRRLYGEALEQFGEGGSKRQQWHGRQSMGAVGRSRIAVDSETSRSEGQRKMDVDARREIVPVAWKPASAAPPPAPERSGSQTQPGRVQQSLERGGSQGGRESDRPARAGQDDRSATSIGSTPKVGGVNRTEARRVDNPDDAMAGSTVHSRREDRIEVSLAVPVAERRGLSPEPDGGDMSACLKELEGELSEKKPWVGTALRYLTEERVPFQMSGEQRVEDLFRRSQCLTVSVARQVLNLSGSQYASMIDRIRSQDQGARSVTIPLGGPGRPLDVLLGSRAKPVDDPEFDHWLGTGFLMAAVVRDASLAGAWRVVMLCRERTVTPTLEPDIQAVLVKAGSRMWLFMENDRGTEGHEQLKKKLEQYKEVLRWVPGATLIWITEGEARAMGILEDVAAVLPRELLDRVFVRAMVGRESVLRLGGSAAPLVLGHLLLRMPNGDVKREVHVLHERRAGEHRPGGGSAKTSIAAVESQREQSGTDVLGQEASPAERAMPADDNKAQKPSTVDPKPVGYAESTGPMGTLVFPGYVNWNVGAQGDGSHA